MVDRSGCSILMADGLHSRFRRGATTKLRHASCENPMATSSPRPTNLQELRDSGWVSKSVKDELRDNFLRALAAGEELFPEWLGTRTRSFPRSASP